LFIGLGLGVGMVILIQLVVGLFQGEFTDFRWYLICACICCYVLL
jgi:hypothetical protein